MAWLKRAALVGIAVFLVIQVYRPGRTNPVVDPKNGIEAKLSVPPEVMTIFNRSCSDCHSNRTQWPWYSAVAPVSWLVTYDVRQGRREMNFSEWGNTDPKKNANALQKICREMTAKEMPGAIYPLMHPGATVTDVDIQTVCRWTESARQGVATETTSNPRP